MMFFWEMGSDMTDSIQTAALLLERTLAKNKRFEEQYRKTGMAYNIFKVAGISEGEVIMCRVLADLLNPKSLHYRGSVYLKLFMDMVAKPLVEKAGNLDLSKAKVTTEYPISNYRRIDIVLDDGTVFIPIEVKIKAREEKRQLADYAAFSEKMNTIVGFVPVLFLTRDGRESDKTAEDKYVRVSFEQHIIPWLVKCLNHEETSEATPVREILQQFIKAIKSFCGNMEDEAMEKAIKDIIAESRDSYTAALLIKKAVAELNFDEKAREIFKDTILSLVKKEFPDAEYVEEGKGDDTWYYLDIPIGKGCKLCINYDMKSFSVEFVNPKIPLAADTAEKIGKIMSGITGVHNEDWKGVVWASANAKYPGLEGIDDDGIYAYELYQLYSKDPQSVADKIKSLVKDLKNI